MLNILIVDESYQRWEGVRKVLEERGWQVSFLNSFDDMDKIKEKAPHLLLIELSPPLNRGINFFLKVKKVLPSVEAIFISSYANISIVVEAMKAGALDFLSRPFSVENLVFKIQEFEEKIKNAPEIITSQFQNSFHLLVGKSKKMQQVFERAFLVSKYDTIVMIVGESGTGKELLARSIHMERAPDKPFIAVHLGIIPEEIAEAELFGYEKGAFTGAYKSKPGKFEIVEDGTLFLDDIDDASYRVQTKLLRVLQDKEFERIGGVRTFKFRGRIIVAAKPTIKEKVEKGLFREDLYYRINVVPIKLPPLRERKEDIPLLVSHFIHKYSQKFGKNLKGITKAALEALMQYDFPGNVRELEHIIERMVCFSRSDYLTETDLSREFPEIFKRRPDFDCFRCLSRIDKLSYNLYDVIDYIEENYIKWAWEKTKGNVLRASKLLGIPRTSLLVKLKKYNLKN